MLLFIQTNFLLIVIACSSGSMLLWALLGNRLRGVQEINTISALQLINHQQALVLDVRESDEFNGGHILQAKHIPLGSLKERVTELESHRTRPIITICRSGQRSSAACAVLVKQGFTQAHSLSGGMMAWQKAGLPTEK